jgi:multidrug resistance efflux pump
MEKGVITRDELGKTSDQLDQAEEELGLARRRTAVVVEMTHPREGRRAALQLAQKASQLAHARARVHETQARVSVVRELIEDCSLYARSPGLVVYEEYLNASPRRKIRIGDRVTSSQGIVTIPEVDRMMVDTSVTEGDVQRVKPGQTAAVRVEAFPDLEFTGRVVRVGTLASSSVFRPLDDKRFDLIIELDPTMADLRPEMTARADIVVGTREGVLLVPVTAVFERQGTFVSYVVGLAGIEARQVDLGESNDRQVEVVEGLREGERVSLTEPATASGAATASPSNRTPVQRNAAQPR